MDSERPTPCGFRVESLEDRALPGGIVLEPPGGPPPREFSLPPIFEVAEGGGVAFLPSGQAESGPFHPAGFTETRATDATALTEEGTFFPVAHAYDVFTARLPPGRVR
jgi:hypothetical protein